MRKKEYRIRFKDLFDFVDSMINSDSDLFDEITTEVVMNNRDWIFKITVKD